MDFLPDDEDMSVLEATMSFVDEYAASVSPPCDALPLLQSSTTPLTPSTIVMAPNSSVDTITRSSLQLVLPTPARQKSSKPRKPQANPNRARNELRFELAYLREKVEQLQSELRALQQSSGKTGTWPGLKPSVRQVSGDQVTLWAGVAQRQRGRREVAERENVRLRIIVDRQRKLATDLSNLLRKRVNQQVSECSHLKDPRITEQRLIRVSDFHGDIGEFQELFQHLESAYQEVDAVLANSLNAMADSSDDVHIREGVDGKYLEFCASKVMPFPVRATSEATWDHFRGAEKHFGNGGLYEKAAKNLDFELPYTVIEDFTKELYSNTSRADMKAKQIVRRYVEADRDIIVLVSSITAAEVQHKAFPGMNYHLRCFVVTKRSPTSTAENEQAQLQFCTRISFDVGPGKLVDSDCKQTRDLTKFLIGNTVGNIKCYQERIENSLIDRQLNQRLQGTALSSAEESIDTSAKAESV